MENKYSLAKMRDPKFYLEKFTKVKTKETGALRPFILKEAQKDIYNALSKYSRIIIRKARQIGASTAVVGFFYHNTIMNPGTNTAIIGYNNDLTAELLDKVKIFYKTTPAALRPTIEYNSKYEISFPKINSKILVLPSTMNVGRGYTLSNVLATELSSWEKAEEKMMTLEASVPIWGKLIIESTPKGQGNLYHRMWMSDNDYIKKDYGWWWEYTREQIAIIRRRMNNPSKFAQEYGLEFLTSGRNVFDVSIIREQRKNVKHEGDIIEDYDGAKHTVRKEDHLLIFKEPNKDDFYVCGVDTSEGIEGGDYSSVTFWNRRTGEEVASYRGLLPPDRLGDKLNVWGRKYNNALMVVEINNHGLTTMTVLKQKLYPTLYFRPAKFETMGNPLSDKLGWKTTKVTRPLLIDEFAQALREGILMVHTKELVDELSVFIYDDRGNMVPQGQFKDDCLKEGTLIKTQEGYKEIENIKQGDFVLTHRGRYREVEACLKKPFDGDWHDVKFNGQLEIGLSYNHPIYVATGNYKGNILLDYKKRQWKLPDKLMKSYKSISVIEKFGKCENKIIEGEDNFWGNRKNAKKKKIKIILNKEFAKFLGLFLADGHCRKDTNQMSIAFHEREHRVIKQIKKYLESLGIHVNKQYIKKQHCCVLLFVSKTLSSLLLDCYDGKKEKKIPSFALSLGEELKEVLTWWLRGDGWRDKKSYDVICATTSKKLALSMRDIAWSCGYYATIHKAKRHRYEKINKDQYYVNIKYSYNENQHLEKLSIFEFGGKLRRIKKINYCGDVYNLQVKEDKSFIANGIVVHNCLFSAAIGFQGFKMMYHKKLDQLDYEQHFIR